MDINININDEHVVTINIDSDSITWKQLTRMSIAAASNVASKISAIFPEYKLVGFHYEQADEWATRGDYHVQAVWGFKLSGV